MNRMAWIVPHSWVARPEHVAPQQTASRQPARAPAERPRRNNPFGRGVASRPDTDRPPPTPHHPDPPDPPMLTTPSRKAAWYGRPLSPLAGRATWHRLGEQAKPPTARYRSPPQPHGHPPARGVH